MEPERLQGGATFASCRERGGAGAEEEQGLLGLLRDGRDNFAESYKKKRNLAQASRDQQGGQACNEILPTIKKIGFTLYINSLKAIFFLVDRFNRSLFIGGTMITIKKSATADTRTCDWSMVTKDQLKESSEQHRKDVMKGLVFFMGLIEKAGERHYFDKLSDLDGFHRDFMTGFKQTAWWDNHRKIARHHLLSEDGIPEDVNLIDVLDMITDCVMAGMGRSGSMYPLHIAPETLMKAFQNTVEILKAQVVVDV